MTIHTQPHNRRNALCRTADFRRDAALKMARTGDLTAERVAKRLAITYAAAHQLLYRMEQKRLLERFGGRQTATWRLPLPQNAANAPLGPLRERWRPEWRPLKRDPMAHAKLAMLTR